MTEDIIKAVHDYYKEHGVYPLRIAVSETMARELDAEFRARYETFGKIEQPPLKLLALGGHMCIQGIPVVADIPPVQVLDLRKETP